MDRSSGAKPRLRTLGPGGFVAISTAAVALVIGAELARPFASASIAFDSQVAVLHFQRIVAGLRLESFVATTPKPLLTLVYGSLYATTHDWRAIAWAAIFAYAIGVGLTSLLATRLAGPMAGAFAAIAVALSPTLTYDVGYALATPWALLCWAIAGLAITSRPPRYAIAGAALAVASLARLETLVVVGVALLVLGWSSVGPAHLRPAIARRAWLVPLMGLLAIPVLLVHDQLLTGDPLFWTTVAVRYSEATSGHVRSPLELLGFLAVRYWSTGALTVLAVIGLVRCIRSRQDGIAIGLIGLGPGIAGFLLVLSLRHVFVSDRYVAGIDAAIAFAAGLGILDLSAGVLALARVRALADRLAAAIPVSPIVAAGLLGALVAGPYWSTTPGLRAGVRDSLALGGNTEAAAQALLPIARAGVGQTGILVPTPVRPRVVVDLGLRLSQVGGLDPARGDLASGYPAPGQIVFIDATWAADSPSLQQLEVSFSTTIGDRQLVPILADPGRGVWVIEVR